MKKRYALILVLTWCWWLEGSAQCDTAMIYADTVNNQVCFDTTYSKVRNCYSNNIPDHEDTYNSPFDLEASEEFYSMCLYPDTAEHFTPLYEEVETSVGCTDTYTFGVSINGVKYDPNSADYFVTGSGDDNIEWHVEARYKFSGNFGNNGGHLNPFGEYHYHDIPLEYFTDSLLINGSQHSTIVGWAADGFPIYYKYVFSDPEDTTSSIVSLSSGYSLKSGSRPGDGDSAPDGSYTGLYYEDYEYTTTTLDSCNGRWGKTPDFPDGTYYYVLTDNYPYIPRCFKGTVLDHSFRVGPAASCPSSTADTDCADAPVMGCTDPFSCNYNPAAEVDDGSCDYNYAYSDLTIDNCGTYTTPSGAMYTTGGTITDTLIVSGSCDTIYNITLTISGATATRNLTAPSTSGSSDGSILFGMPSGGMPPYSFSVDSGMTYIMSTPPRFNGLGEGDYWTVVKDDEGCEMFEMVSLSAALPVALVSLAAQLVEETVRLRWVTSLEINSAHFVIERSEDGQLFVPIGSVPAQQHSQLRQNYQYIDQHLSSRQYYYRLKMVDQDGQYAYSEIIVIDDLFAETIPLRLYPNPTATLLTVENGQGTATIYSQLGEKVKQLTVTDDRLTIDINELPAGQYFLQIIDPRGNRQSVNFLKVRP